MKALARRKHRAQAPARDPSPLALLAPPDIAEDAESQSAVKAVQPRQTERRTDRQRERERERDFSVCVYIYIERERANSIEIA